MAAIPATRYVKSDDVHIAYQMLGEGSFDLLLVPGFVSHLEAIWQSAGRSVLLRRLASFCRLILFDKRGPGMSDRGSQHRSWILTGDDRTRRVLVIGTMMALAKWDEFRMNARAAFVEGGFTADDVKEIILQQAIYCGVPAANHSFKLAAGVLTEIGQAPA